MFVNSKVLIAVLVVLVCSPVDAILKPTKTTKPFVLTRTAAATKTAWLKPVIPTIKVTVSKKPKRTAGPKATTTPYMGPKKQKRSRLMPRQVVGGGADEVETATVAALLPRQDQETVAAFFPRATKSTKPWGRRRLFPRQAEATAEAGPLSTPLVETVPEGNPMSEDLVY